MFSFGTITFYQLNILFVIAVLTAVIFLLMTVLLVLRYRRLKRSHDRLALKMQKQAEQLQAPQELDESTIEDITKRVLRRVVEIMKGKS